MSPIPRAHFRTGIIHSLFFVSGACGLIYQVVWTRLMTHVFGSTLLAVSTVLAAFMAGLALGSYVLGKRADRCRSPLRLYAYYEIGIGLAAVAVLLLLDRLTPFYLWLSDSFGSTSLLFGLGRFVVIFAIILIPTTLMGATLPILGRLVIDGLGQVGRRLGGLYAINTVGAVAGCLLAGFYLIAEVGTHIAIHLAATLNLLVGAASWWLDSKQSRAAESEPTATPKRNRKAGKPKGKAVTSPFTIRLLLVGFALSGMTSFAFEVFWARALVFYVGNSTYAVTTMLAAFLIGVALGGYLARHLVDRSKSPVRLFAGLQIGIGLTAAVAMPLLSAVIYSETFRGWFQSTAGNWGNQLLLNLTLCLLVMLVPTTLIGMIFPLVGRILLRDLRQTGETVGKAYAVNTLGNIVGALAPAFLIIPLLGIHKGILAMSTINVAVGLSLLVYGRGRSHITRYAFPAAMAAGIAWVVRSPSPSQFPSDTQAPDDEVVYYREGPSATTKVFVKPLSGDKHISVDGIQIGGSDDELNYKQQWLAHVPKLLLADFHTELSIGLGSGILVGESVRHPGIERVTCVEIAPTVVEGAGYFRDENHGVLESPKLEMVINDGVNYLLTSRRRYDIISTDAKTDPEHGVNGVFFSREYYTLMRDRLAPGGLAIQWIPTHYPPRIFKTVIHTCAEVFPHAQLWFSEGNCFLIASNHRLAPDPEEIDRRLGDPELPFDGLRRFGLDSSASLLAHLVATEDMLRQGTQGIPSNTLERPNVEFYKADDFAGSKTARQRANLDFLLSLRGKGEWGERIQKFHAEVTTAYAAEGKYLQALKSLLSGEPGSVVESQFAAARKMAPGSNDIRYSIYGHYLQTCRDLMAMGRFDRASYYAQKAASMWEDSADAHQAWGFSLLQTGRISDAFGKLEVAVRLDPNRVGLHRMIADFHLQNRRPSSAAEHLREIIRQKPRDLPALNNLGSILTDAGQLEEALAHLKKAHGLAPDDPNVLDSYAWVLFQSGDHASARSVIRAGGEYFRQSSALAKRRRIMLGE